MIKFLAAILAVAAASSAPAATYVGNRTVGTATASLSITTDDTIGILSGDNILDWSVVLATALGNATLYGPASGDTSRIELRGTALSATATNLLFDFSAAGQAYLLFQSTEGDRSLYCVQTVNCFDQTRGEEIISVGPTFTDFQREVRSGSLTLGSTAAAAVPEPATWAMMIGGLAMAGGSMRLRRRAKARVGYAGAEGIRSFLPTRAG